MLSDLFRNNVTWAESIKRQDPEFFLKLSRQQAPEYLWIGCADSRVPANEIVGLLPGELFVHRNVANIVLQTDINCLSVLQYAVDVLQIRHIIVCGHYGCGGVKAAMQEEIIGLLDNWLHSVSRLYLRNRPRIDELATETERVDALCELNVIEQVANVCHTSIVRRAWKRGQPLSVHGWIYGIGDGLLRDLKVSASCIEEAPPLPGE